jgi:hypothetical protein
MEKQWEDFEKLTKNIFTKLIGNEAFEKVERNIKVHGKDGVRQIDILLTTLSFGLELKTVIECKDHTSKVSVGVVDALHSKMQDVNASKGVIVSRLGFSSKAVAKAKRLGITLCTAHEALHPAWNIDMPIPVLVTAITPVESLPEFYCHINDALREIEIDDGSLIINDVDTLKLFSEKWNNGELELALTEDLQTLEFPAIQDPFFLTNIHNEKIRIDGFEFHVKLKIEHYLGFLDQIQNAQVLKNVTEGKFRYFIDDSPIEDFDKTFLKLKKREIPAFEKLAINIRMYSTISHAKIQVVQVD